MQTFIGSRWTFLLVLNLFLIFVGMTMDVFSAIVVVVPLIWPIAQHFGVNPYHLGVIFLLNLEIGYLTPPLGLNLFISSFRFERSVFAVCRAVLPFIVILLGLLAVVTYVPGLSTWSSRLAPPIRLDSAGPKSDIPNAPHLSGDAPRSAASAGETLEDLLDEPSAAPKGETLEDLLDEPSAAPKGETLEDLLNEPSAAPKGETLEDLLDEPSAAPKGETLEDRLGPSDAGAAARPPTTRER
jgi:hypothetical protein